MNYDLPKQHVYDQKDDRPRKNKGEFTLPKEYLENIVIPFFEVAREVCTHQGIEIYNVCPQSRIPHEVIPKCTPDDVAHMVR